MSDTATTTQALLQTAPENLSAEAKYRFYKRLGILCGNAVATPEQLRIAQLEAVEYDMNHD